MPLAQPPNRGFSEFQRTVPYDTDAEYSATDNVIAGNEVTSILDVSRSAYLGGYDLLTAGAVLATFTWFMDAAGTISAGSRQMVLSSAITFQAQYRLPNLGPFLIVSWVKISAGNATHTTELFGTNRAHPCELIPTNPVLVDRDAAAITSSATVTVPPSDYYSGPMMVWSTISSGGTVFFQYLTSGNVWNTIQQWPVAALTNVQTTVVAPPGAWRFQVLNGVASAQTYNLKVTPSLTGGS